MNPQQIQFTNHHSIDSGFSGTHARPLKECFFTINLVVQPLHGSIIKQS